MRDRLAALEAPQTRVIKRDSCEQLNETISRRRGTHGIAEGLQGQDYGLVLAQPQGRRRSAKNADFALTSRRGQHDNSWLHHSAVSFDHRSGQRGRERHSFPLFHPRQGSEPHQDCLRASAARSRLDGRTQDPCLRIAHPRDQQGQWKVDRCDDHGSRPVRAWPRHRSVDGSGACAGLPWPRPGKPQSDLRFSF